MFFFCWTGTRTEPKQIREPVSVKTLSGKNKIAQHHWFIFIFFTFIYIFTKFSEHVYTHIGRDCLQFSNSIEIEVLWWTVNRFSGSIEWKYSFAGRCLLVVKFATFHKDPGHPYCEKSNKCWRDANENESLFKLITGYISNTL